VISDKNRTMNNVQKHNICTDGRKEECIQNICGKSRRKKKPLERPRSSWVDNIKMDIR
jgi:hypothetical protein